MIFVVEQALIAGHSIIPISAVGALTDKDDLFAVLDTGLEVILRYGLIGNLLWKLTFLFLGSKLAAEHVLV